MDNMENLVIGRNVLKPVPNIGKDLVIILNLPLVEKIALVKPFPVGFALNMIAKVVRNYWKLWSSKFLLFNQNLFQIAIALYDTQLNTILEVYQ